MHCSSHLKIKSNFLFPRYNLLLFFFFFHRSLIHSQPLTLLTPTSLSTSHSLDVTDTGTARHHKPPTSPSPTHKPTVKIIHHHYHSQNQPPPLQPPNPYENTLKKHNHSEEKREMDGSSSLWLGAWVRERWLCGG